MKYWITLVALLMIGTPPVLSEEPLHYCRVFFETEEKIPSDLAAWNCKPGDDLSIFINRPHLLPATVSSYCDLRFNVWTDNLAGMRVVACRYTWKYARELPPGY